MKGCLVLFRVAASDERRIDQNVANQQRKRFGNDGGWTWAISPFPKQTSKQHQNQNQNNHHQATSQAHCVCLIIHVHVREKKEEKVVLPVIKGRNFFICVRPFYRITLSIGYILCVHSSVIIVIKIIKTVVIGIHHIKEFPFCELPSKKKEGK